ncbi:MAG TPA: sulfotransferase [Pedococcus sp.]
MSGDATVRVLYVAGSGRSGSTVMTTVLGQLPGMFAAGEVRYLWERGVQHDHLCGCGRPFSECPVWTSVMKRVRDDAGAVDEPAIGRRLLRRLRIRRLPLLLARRSLGRPPVPFHADDAHLARLYHAVAEETGARVVVDSSKLPPYALLLGQLPGVEVLVLHVVRDPRATAWSWQRLKDSRDGSGLMHRQESWKASMLWLVWNVLAAVLWRPGSPRVCRVRYEDFARAPREALAPVARMLGARPEDLPFVTEDSVRLAPTHAVAGNPNRHDSGVVRVHPDDEWTHAMPLREKAVVSTLTAPGLLMLGYPLVPRHAHRSPD